MTEHTTIRIRKDTKPLFEQVKDLTAEEIGDKPSNADAFEEACRAYLGQDALGKWNDER